MGPEAEAGEVTTRRAGLEVRGTIAIPVGERRDRLHKDMKALMRDRHEKEGLELLRAKRGGIRLHAALQVGVDKI